MKKILLVICVASLLVGSDTGFLEGAATEGGKGGAALKPTGPAGTPTRTKMTINNVVAWYDANGSEERNSATTNAGLQYPRGTADVIYAAGLMYSGIHDDGRTPALRTNGHSYNTGFGRGALLGLRTGVREDPAAPDVRIWRIRRDYATADLAYDAAEINSIGQSNVSQAQIDAVRAQYATDWIDWPAHKGAPFYDADGDGLYSRDRGRGAGALSRS
jgi:hypothetical protein